MRRPAARGRGDQTAGPPAPAAGCGTLVAAAYSIPAVAVMWGIGGIGLEARHKWSIYIPVTQRGEPVSWTTRSIGKGGKRYHGAAPEEESVAAKDLLYGADLARHGVVIGCMRHPGPCRDHVAAPGHRRVSGPGYLF